MAIDASGVWPTPSCRRGVAANKFRVREERKRVIRLSNEKYRTIDDHESGLRRFVLIKNTLRRLQREAREEKLARHRAGTTSVSPSYLSASRPRASSPPCDMQVSDVLNEYGQPTPAPLTSLEEDDPMSSPAKKIKLFHDDDKENSRDSCETRLQCEMDQKDDGRGVIDDTQEILRDLYETLTPEPLSPPRPGTPTPPPRPDTPYSTSPYSCNLPTTTTSSLAATSNINTTCSATATTTNTTTTTTSLSGGASSGSGSFYEWSRPQQQQYACGHASLLGNDLQSVVFHSLIASLES